MCCMRDCQYMRVSINDIYKCIHIYNIIYIYIYICIFTHLTRVESYRINAVYTVSLGKSVLKYDGVSLGKSVLKYDGVSLGKSVLKYDGVSLGKSVLKYDGVMGGLFMNFEVFFLAHFMHKYNYQIIELIELKCSK